MGTVLDSFNNPPDEEVTSLVLPGQNPLRPWDGADVYGNNAFFNNLVAETFSLPTPPIANGTLSPLALRGTYITTAGINTPIPSATVTPIAWTSVNNQVPGFFTAAVGGTTITAIMTGVYLISLSCQYPASATGTRRDVILEQNGSPFLSQQSLPISGAVGATGVLTWTMQLNAGDTISLAMYQDSGATMNPGTGLSGNIICTLIADVP